MSLNESMRRSLAYGKKYGVVLEAKRLEERLISKNYYENKTIKEWMENNGSNLGKYGKREKEIYERKMKLAKELLKEIKKFEGILFMGVTGSVASEYPKEKDDIDLMIICKRNRLWKTRFWLRVMIFRKGIKHRKRGRRGNSDEFCFNLWLDEDSLKIPKVKRNLRNGMDMIMTKTLINREGIYERYWKENDWVKKYLINEYLRRERRYEKRERLKRGEVCWWHSWENWLYFWPQYWYMKLRKINKELVDSKRAFFHPF